MKTSKRLLMENMDSRGDLDTDKFGRAMFEYRNTPNPDTRLFPAQVVFGRNVRDFIPACRTSMSLVRSGVCCKRIRKELL